MPKYFINFKTVKMFAKIVFILAHGVQYIIIIHIGNLKFDIEPKKSNNMSYVFYLKQES